MTGAGAGRWLRTLRHLQPQQWIGQGGRVAQRLFEPVLAPAIRLSLDQATRHARLERPRDNPVLAGLAKLDATLLDPEQARRAAQDFAQGWFGAAGVREQVAAPGQAKVDWQRAPSALFAYSLHYGADVAAAARQAYLQSDGALAKAVLERMLDWVAHCAPPASPGWRPYVIAVRASYWGRALYYLDSMDQLPADAALVLARSLAAQAWYLRSHLEYALGANHLQRDYVGLLLLSRLLSGCGEGQWRQVATAGLRQQLVLQWLGDGGHLERCPGYHAQALLDLAEARAAAAGTLQGDIDRVLSKGLALLAALVHPDGTPPRFGDTSLDLLPDPMRLLHSLGPLPAPGQSEVQLFADSGFCVVHSPDHHLVMDFGPLGPDHQCGHAHADAGAFEWSVRGQRLIIDVGVPGYDGCGDRPFARSAAAHNVAVADGRDHAELWQTFRVGWRPVLSRQWQVDGSSVQLAIRWVDDFCSPHLQMSRVLQVRPGHLTVQDCAVGARQQRVRLTLHPEATASLTAAGWRIERGAGRLDLRVTGGSVAAEAGRVWHTMGAGEPTTCLVLSGGPALDWTLAGDDA